MRQTILIGTTALSLMACVAMAFVSLPSRNADAQGAAASAAGQGGVYINAVDLVIIPSEMPKFLEAIKENGANSVKEPGVRQFNITVLANRPNHVFLYEVYENEAALAAHRTTEHYKKYQAATANMVADRNVRPMSVVALNSKAH